MRRLAALTAAFVLLASGTAIGSGTSSFTVSSTLSDKHVLPHRIRWLGKPSLPPTKIREVDFLIDGRLSWIEHHAPYTFGYDGNYLVTTWLKPGVHTFTVVAISTSGRRARSSSRAQTFANLPPPAALDGSWHRRISASDVGATGSPGTWTLTVNSVGWRFLDPTRRRGALIDVAYLSPTVVEARGGISTRDHDPRENNPWCDEPFEPVRYAVQTTGDRLTITRTGIKACDGQADVWAGVWTRD
jgi:hypothetical protein